MTSTFSHVATVAAGVAVIATGFTVSGKGLLRGLFAAIAFGVAAVRISG
jgi:hypothetical protein